MSNCRITGVFELEAAAFLFNERTQTMFISRILNSMIALTGCSIAAAVAIAVPMSTGGTQALNLTLGSRSFLEQRRIIASQHEPRMQLLAGPVVAPVGEGWG
jgi:hypothetical protein